MKTVLGIALTFAVALSCHTSTASAMDHVYAPASLESVPDMELRQELANVAPNYDALDRASQVDVYARVWSMHNQTRNTFIGNGIYAERNDPGHESPGMVFTPGAAFDPYRHYYIDNRHSGYDSPRRRHDSPFGGRRSGGEYGYRGYDHSGTLLGGPIFGDYGRREYRR